MAVRAIAALVVAVGLTGCVTATTTVVDSASGGTAQATASPTTMGTALNAARAANGLSGLVPNAALMTAAQQQASFMAQTGTLTHSGSGGSTVGQRARAAGCSWSWVAENVAVGQGSDQATMDGWMASPGHRRNALNTSATAYGSAEVGGYRALVLAGGC